jgi:hypothetical protein
VSWNFIDEDTNFGGRDYGERLVQNDQRIFVEEVMLKARHQ